MLLDTRSPRVLRRALVAALAAATVWTTASLATAAKGPQLLLVKSAASDPSAGFDDSARAVVVKGSKYFVAGYKSGETNGRNAACGDTGATLDWDGWSHDGFPHLDDEFHDVALNRKGEVYAAGYSNQTGRGRDVFIQKYMKNMRGADTGTYYDAIGDDDEAHGVAIAKDGTVFVVGEATEPRSGTNVWLGKYDADLNYVTSGSYGSPNVAGDSAMDAGHAIAIDADGNLVVAGTVVRAGTGADIWVGKFDQDLHFVNEAWVAGDTSGRDAAYGLAIDKKHRIWVVGTIAVPGDVRDVWVGGFDADLNPIGSVTRSIGTGDDDAFGVVTDNKGHLFVAGRTAAGSGGTAPWLGVFDTNFNFVTETTFASPAVGVEGHDGAYHLALLPANCVLVVGGVTTAEGGGDAWMAKYKALRLPVVRQP